MDHFIFEKEFNSLLNDSMTMRDASLKAFELAKNENSAITLRCYNEYIHYWETLGTYFPDGTMIDTFGDKCRLSEDGNNFKRIKDEPTKMD